MEETKAAEETRADATPGGEAAPAGGTFWNRYGGWIFIGGFSLYLVLLIIGVVAELFHIQSILDWWIWRPPGKPPGDFRP